MTDTSPENQSNNDAPETTPPKEEALGKGFDTLSISDEVKQAVAALGYKHMTPIQEQAIPVLLTGVDFLGQAPTGTGKTVAFGLPLVEMVKPDDGNHIKALVIGPTRELVIQITKEINKLGAVKGIKALAVYGGEKIYNQKEALRGRDIDIIVGTPGRILDHIGQLTIDLSRTRTVVLDEADEMLDMGFRDDIESILRNLPGGRMTWLFSATISPEIRQISTNYQYYPEEVMIKNKGVDKPNIDQYFYVVNADDKPKQVLKFFEHNDDFYGVVFCETKRDVVQLARYLRGKISADCLHGAMFQSDREKVMEAFKKKEIKLLVSTDITARGIDVDSLTHVINYDVPTDSDYYIHRIGRTARAGRRGIAITLAQPGEQYDLERLQKKAKTTILPHPDSEEPFVEGGARRERYDKNARSGGRGGRGGSGGGRSYGGGGKSEHPNSNSRHKGRRKPSSRPGKGGGGGQGGSGGGRKS